SVSKQLFEAIERQAEPLQVKDGARKISWTLKSNSHFAQGGFGRIYHSDFK
ncbi:MAG: hypothetical protein MHPSP_002712, partial [Paramarteilia canceri]